MGPISSPGVIMQHKHSTNHTAGRAGCNVGLGLIVACLTLLPAAAIAGTDLSLRDGGFEAGLAAPWGTGQVVSGDGTSIWKNLNGCTSTITADSAVRHGGNVSLHIVNSTPRAPHVYGTTQQPLALKPNHRYGITLWARASDVRSAGAVSIIVDPEWRIRPIQLPAGSYDWTPFTGEFSSPDGNVQLRILSEDVGEVWLDDVEIVSLEAEEPPAAPPVDPGIARVRVLTEGLGKFRSLALQDIDTALADLADETARDDFRELTEKLWPLSDPKIGWSYFFSFSTIAAVRPDSTFPVVAYIHPWSDVVLVTSWSIDGESARLTGAEVIPGEVFRTRTMPPPGQGPAWIVDPMFKPAALAQNVAGTVTAFEKAYGAPLVASWRNVWITMTDSDVKHEQLQSTCAARYWSTAWPADRFSGNGRRENRMRSNRCGARRVASWNWELPETWTRCGRKPPKHCPRQRKRWTKCRLRHLGTWWSSARSSASTREWFSWRRGPSRTCV